MSEKEKKTLGEALAEYYKWQAEEDGRNSELSGMSCSTSIFYPLFEHMAQTHGLTLTESEMSDIASICEKINAEDAELPENLRDTEAVVKEVFRRMDNS